MREITLATSMNKIIAEKAVGTLYDLKELNVIKKIINSQKPLSYGKEISDSPAKGYLAIKKSWPGQMRTIYGDHKRFKET